MQTAYDSHRIAAQNPRQKPAAYVKPLTTWATVKKYIPFFICGAFFLYACDPFDWFPTPAPPSGTGGKLVLKPVVCAGEWSNKKDACGVYKVKRPAAGTVVTSCPARDGQEKKCPAAVTAQSQWAAVNPVDPPLTQPTGFYYGSGMNDRRAANGLNWTFGQYATFKEGSKNVVCSLSPENLSMNQCIPHGHLQNKRGYKIDTTSTKDRYTIDGYTHMGMQHQQVPGLLQCANKYGDKIFPSRIPATPEMRKNMETCVLKAYKDRPRKWFNFGEGDNDRDTSPWPWATKR
jgi:hypothetical protein